MKSFFAKWGFRILSTLALIAALVWLALALTPFPSGLSEAPNQSAEFVDRHGKPLRTLLVDQERFSRICPLEAVSPNLIHATLSAEDKRFRSHFGMDPFALVRAMVQTARGKKPSSGASTITQQLVKLVRPSPRTLKNKAAELWLALRVEREWDKNRILIEYLNRLDYGNLQVGIATASRYYFGKPPSDLSPAESALLASLPKAPSRLNPRHNTAAALARQKWTLQRMCANGWIDSHTYERAISEPLAFRPAGREFEAPHFVDLLLTRKDIVPKQGGIVQTTLDLELNRFAETCIEQTLRTLSDKHATAAAAVILDNATGEVLALSSSGQYFQAGTGEINCAWMPRSPGSTMKPFTTLLALQQGHHPCTVVPDVPSVFLTPTGLYRPNNYNHRFYGPVSIRSALGNSLNIAAIRILELGGGPEALHQAMRQAGITTFGHPAEYYGLGLTLGNGEVRLLEMTNAFATLARLGEHKPFRLLSRDTLETSPTKQIFDRDAAYLVADILNDNGARAASFGLDSFLRFEFPVACKTGTSSDYRDNWTFGYTPEFTVGVWVGNPDGSPMQGITGVTGATPILHDLFEHLHSRFGTSWFKASSRIRPYSVDPFTGRLAPPDCPRALMEQCVTSPESPRAADYAADGRVLLPPLYNEWLGSSQNTFGSLLGGAQAATELQILQPTAGTVYYLDADVPLENQWIRLQTTGASSSAQSLSWECASAPIANKIEGTRLQLCEGRHTLTVRDSVSQQTATTWIEVKHW